MWIFFFLSLSVVALASSTASARTVYAAFERADPPFEHDAAACGSEQAAGLVGYVGTRRVCANQLVDQLRLVDGLIDGSVDEVVLLTSQPLVKTLYRVGLDRRVILPIGNLVRPRGDPLTLRGQVGPKGQHLVWFKGLDLIDTVCDPERVLDLRSCRAGKPAETAQTLTAKWDGRYELTTLALVEEAEVARALRRRSNELGGVTDRGPRGYCIRLKHVRGIVLTDLAFEDCWITAILVVNSREITLKRARIHGSTFGMLAIATSGMERDVHTFKIVQNHWIQSPAAYRPNANPCKNPHLNLSCAVDIWDDLPWGVTHHHLWRPLNGALFGAYNIAGNVLFKNNLLERAYNGIRMISRFPWTGRNVEIRGNRFRFLRDNAVEPEVHAKGWVVSNNIFENVHAWISSDGVQGGSMYVFGNLGWYDPNNLPGGNCNKHVDWSRSPRLVGMAGNAAHYQLIDTSYDATSVECLGHMRGTILKSGDKRRHAFPYFEWISIFNNSWRTRSPLFASKHASPLSHFNNAVEFTGCGLDGALNCRQVPAPVKYCQSGNKRTRGRIALKQFWTSDKSALVADCFTMTPGPAEADERATARKDISHIFCRDAFNRTVTGFPYGSPKCALIVRQKLFATAARGNLTLMQPLQGCQPQSGNGAVFPKCNGTGPLVGAVQADGSLFDMTIPGAGFLGRDFQP